VTRRFARPLCALAFAACSRYDPPPEPPVLEVGPDMVGRVCSEIPIQAFPVDGEAVTWTLEAAPPRTTLPDGEVIPADLEIGDTSAPSTTVSAQQAGQYFVRATADSGSELVKIIVTDEVTIGADVVDPDDGEYSLRELVYSAQACPGDHTVILPPTLSATLDAPLVIDGQGLDDNALTIEQTPNPDPLAPRPIPAELRATGAFRVLEIEEASVTLYNVSLRDGVATDGRGGGAAWIGPGGFLQVRGGYDPAEVSGHRAEDTDGGGAIHMASGAAGLALYGVRLVDNQTDGDGGALHLAEVAGPLLQFTFVEITGNEAAGRGGGIYAAGGSLELSDTEVVENTAGEAGGGVCVDGGELTGTAVVSDNVPDDLCGE